MNALTIFRHSMACMTVAGHRTETMQFDGLLDQQGGEDQVFLHFVHDGGDGWSGPGIFGRTGCQLTVDDG